MFIKIDNSSLLNLNACDVIRITGTGKRYDRYFYAVMAYKYHTGIAGEDKQYCLFEGDLDQCENFLNEISEKLNVLYTTQ